MNPTKKRTGSMRPFKGKLEVANGQIVGYALTTGYARSGVYDVKDIGSFHSQTSENLWPFIYAVRENLIIELDAQNYDGSGINWPDSAVTQNNYAVLYNSPVYVSSGPVYFNFNGYSFAMIDSARTDEYSPAVGLGDFTFEIWLSMPSVGGYSHFIDFPSQGAGRVYKQQNGSVYMVPYPDTAGPSTTQYIVPNTWTQLVVTRSDQVLYYYQDGLPKSHIDNFYGFNLTSSILSLRGSSERLDTSIGLFRMYNKYLNRFEVLQNFSVSRTRFGI